MPNFIKIRPVGAELLHADGRTGRQDEPNSRSSQFFPKATKTLNANIPVMKEISWK